MYDSLATYLFSVPNMRGVGRFDLVARPLDMSVEQPDFLNCFLVQGNSNHTRGNFLYFLTFNENWTSERYVTHKNSCVLTKTTKVNAKNFKNFKQENIRRSWG